MTLRIQLLTETARPPCRAEPGSVGYDIRADLPQGNQVIFPGGRMTVPTGIAVAIPPGCYGRVAPRSGLAAGYGIDVLAGVVDPSYRGEVKVILLNTGDRPMTVSAGDKIAQLILERCETPVVEVVADLGETERGANGFGSSGVR